ncbi:hypothetical protein SAMN05216326_10756 [Nitrosomonas marina]|uniref:Uncharacterized protein n=1 Tax=Nitrosomonas marina TaxID=917 RepID=A0A1I0AHI8_9PROT|nr:hypothetical protein SAMN05216326_10756 [Nitrosomonas marina]
MCIVLQDLTPNFKFMTPNLQIFDPKFSRHNYQNQMFE